MAAQTPTKAKFVKTQGTQLKVSKLPTLNPKDPDLLWADLAVTIKQPQFQGGQSDEIEVSTLAMKSSRSGTFDARAVFSAYRSTSLAA